MNHMVVRVIICKFFLSVVALAQSARAAAPSAPLTLPDRIGIVSIQSAIVGTNDGQRDLQSLAKKFEPKKNELRSLGDELDGLRKQLEMQGAKLNDEARASLNRQIESKQKGLSRAQEDAQNDFTEQQNEIVQKILQKLLPVIDKYANDNALSLVVEASKPWPDSPVLWARPSIDITKAIVDIYNGQLGSSLEHSSGGVPRESESHTQPQKASPVPRGSPPQK